MHHVGEQFLILLLAAVTEVHARWLQQSNTIENPQSQLLVIRPRREVVGGSGPFHVATASLPEDCWRHSH
jgi:hypothetical protein